MSKEKDQVTRSDAVFTGVILAFITGMTLFSCIVIVYVVF